MLSTLHLSSNREGQRSLANFKRMLFLAVVRPRLPQFLPKTLKQFQPRPTVRRFTGKSDRTQ